LLFYVVLLFFASTQKSWTVTFWEVEGLAVFPDKLRRYLSLQSRWNIDCYLRV